MPKVQTPTTWTRRASGNRETILAEVDKWLTTPADVPGQHSHVALAAHVVGAAAAAMSSSHAFEVIVTGHPQGHKPADGNEPVIPIDAVEVKIRWGHGFAPPPLD